MVRIVLQAGALKKQRVFEGEGPARYDKQG